MKKTIYFAIIFLFTIGFTAVKAQYVSPIQTGNGTPVLIDDAHSRSLDLAFEQMQKERTTLIGKIASLSDKQKNQIERIENSRNKRLMCINKKMLKEKVNLKFVESQPVLNVKQKDKLLKSISKLAIKKQKIRASAMTKIKSILSAEQISKL